MAGFVSFLLDCLFPGRCVNCGTWLGAADRSARAALPRGWPRETAAFFQAEFSIQVAGCFDVPARVLCRDCWCSLEYCYPAGVMDDGVKATGNRSTGGLIAGHGDGAACTGTVTLVAPFITNDVLLGVIRFLKFDDGRAAVPPLAWWMAHAYERYGHGRYPGSRNGTVVVPVPLHPSRQRRRGYNQADLLGRSVAGLLGFEFTPLVLVRTRPTRQQAKLDPCERMHNVRGAFYLVNPAGIEGRDVVLVDDLVTTGETVRSCIDALETGSPLSVSVLSAGRASQV